MAESSLVEAQPTSLTLALTLGIFGVVSGLLLVGAYELTLPIIQRNDERALREAVLEVVPQARSMKKLTLDPTTAEHSNELLGAYGAYDRDGALRGYALVGEGPGFQDVIRLIYGVDLGQQRITGMKVLDSRETPGLGDKIDKDPDFKKNFDDLLVEPDVVAAKKQARTAAENQVDIITGATISSKAVVSIINQTNQRWLHLLPTPSGATRRPGPKPPEKLQKGEP